MGRAVRWPSVRESLPETVAAGSPRLAAERRLYGGIAGEAAIDPLFPVGADERLDIHAVQFHLQIEGLVGFDGAGTRRGGWSRCAGCWS